MPDSALSSQDIAELIGVALTEFAAALTANDEQFTNVLEDTANGISEFIAGSVPSPFRNALVSLHEYLVKTEPGAG